MAADHVLSFEVITTTGKFVNASATENSDLFWALRGGVSHLSREISRLQLTIVYREEDLLV
jgi:hypothetical protein